MKTVTDIVRDELIIASVVVEDIGSDKYYRMRIYFPDGSYRDLYPSFKTLQSKTGILKKA